MGLVVFEKPGQEGALNTGESGGIGEEFQWSVHLGSFHSKAGEDGRVKNGEVARTSNVQLPTLNNERQKLPVIGVIVCGADGQKPSMWEKSLSASARYLSLQGEMQHSAGQKC